jgi:pyruvate dehydrogenase E2 component (dihydrolipoamide acetyltransferase)
MPGSMEKQLFGMLPDSIKYLILKFICQQPGLFQRYFGTIGLSNIGKHGVQYFFPVWLNTVVFGAGSIAEKPVAVDGQVRAEPVLPLTLCFNHCVIDGVDAARALASMRRYIEQGEYESALSNDAGLN